MSPIHYRSIAQYGVPGFHALLRKRVSCREGLVYFNAKTRGIRYAPMAFGPHYRRLGNHLVVPGDRSNHLFLYEVVGRRNREMQGRGTSNRTGWIMGGDADTKDFGNSGNALAFTQPAAVAQVWLYDVYGTTAQGFTEFMRFNQAFAGRYRNL